MNGKEEMTMRHERAIVFGTVFLLRCSLVNGIHFNGGSIRWEPVNAADSSNVVNISIKQAYSWTYPEIDCLTNVPITTSGRNDENTNLTCLSGCGTSGGYMNRKVNILTDCVSVSTSLNMMTSERSTVIPLSDDAHFYLAYQGSAWVALNEPARDGHYWSITTYIDLRRRADGSINTPPWSSVISPQYVVVNEATQIRIPVSDANGDVVRCRWSKQQPGSRRRRRYFNDGDDDDDEEIEHLYGFNLHKTAALSKEDIHIRKKRKHRTPKPTPAPCGGKCSTKCDQNCLCSCPSCSGTTCTGWRCYKKHGCKSTVTASETPGTLPTTISYPNRQAVDECGSVCHPSSVPSGTVLNNCSLTFTGLVPDRWYAIAVQVEDFISESNTTAMSSVPVQFLIYVMDEPTCTEPPEIIPLTGCLDVPVGVPKSFNISVENMCSLEEANITDIVVSTPITGINAGPLTVSSNDPSVVYTIYTWTPQSNQIGAHQFCTIAFTEELLQSKQYCVTLTVITSSATCVTTTTSTSATTSQTTTTTSATTTTTSATTSTTSTTSTTTTTTTSTTATTTKAPSKGPHWALILGLALLALLMASCCAYLGVHCYRKKQNRRLIGRQPQRQSRFSSKHNPSMQDEYFQFPLRDWNSNLSNARSSLASTRLDRPSLPKTKLEGVNIVRVGMLDRPSVTGNEGIRPPNRTSETRSTPVRHPSSNFSVRRVSKSFNVDDTLSIAETAKAQRRPSRISVIKLPRNRSASIGPENPNPRARARSIGDVQVTKIRRLSYVM